MKYENKIELFETVPIYKAALTLIVPTVISQLVILVYNTADTWYIGKTGDASQVAAVTVTYPIFMLLNAISNLFAIGGASLISRLLGLKKRNEAGKVASFTLWASVFSTLLLSMICYVFADKVLSLLKVQA